MPKIDLQYRPLVFIDEQPPSYRFIQLFEFGIGIEISQPDQDRLFYLDGLGYIYQQERALETGHAEWVAARIVELENTLNTKLPNWHLRRST